jgi:ADP-ribose pyrophosphatase
MATEKITETRKIYEGRVFDVRVDTVELPDGSQYKREVVQHPGAVAIVPIDETGSVIMVNQYRIGSEKHLLEIPAGGLKVNEPPDKCARRELQEEIGYYPDQLIELGKFWVAPGYTTEHITIFLARDLRPSRLPGDADENIVVERIPFQQAFQQALDNQFEDGKTLIGLMWASAYLDQND